jgi:murein DD-endopeptidase MepM/ murein hydrolase activator NlpD
MNPEDLDLPQPPEGILDPQIPWSYVRPQSPLWNTLKARLTGRPTNGEHYSSYVNLTEADADRLIENLKKDPRGYPSLDQESGTPVQWMERQQKYQEWLVEEYLEKPFRKKVDAKIEEAEIDRLVNQRRESKVKPATPLIPSTKPPAPEPQPAPDLILDIPEEPKVELIPEIPAPVVQPEPEKPKPSPLRDEDLTVPYMMPSNVMRSMAKYGLALDKVGNELSKQNFKLERSLGYLRRIDEDLDDAKFLLEQMSENYQEALDDFEIEERKKAARKKFIANLTSPFRKKQEDKKVLQPPQKLSRGGISNQVSEGKIIQPGIYDNPTVGSLPPGSAVIPLNRNYGKEILNQYNQQEYLQSFTEVLTKSISALLGSAVAVYGSTLRTLGPLAGYFNNSIPGIIGAVSSILGLSRGAVVDLFGGPAYAGTTENTKDLKSFYKSWRVYMNNNNLYFPGAGGVFGGPPAPKGEIAKDILIIGPQGEGLMGMSGTNVGQPPAWIPFSKDSAGKILYISGYGWRWGKQHTGIDLAGNRGIKIITPFAGEIYDVNRGAVEGDSAAGGGYGNLVGIKHDQPKAKTFYGHLQDVAEHLQVGTKVKAGEVIGTLGNTGRSTGPHLHWEVLVDDRRIDPVPWTHENKPSLAAGGNVWWRNIQRVFTNKGSLSTKGVRAGFTGMGKAGFDAIMGGDKFRLPTKKSLIGSGSQPVLGRGAYSAPTIKGALRYQKPGGGVVKTIVPRGAVRSSLIDIIEPQSRVKPATFDKGKLLADRLLSGEWKNSALANRLRQQLTSGQSVQTMTRFSGLGRGAAAMRVGSVLARASNPIGLGVTGGELLTPVALNLAKQRREAQQRRLNQLVPSGAGTMPSDGSIPTIVPTKSKPQFINIDIPTRTIMQFTQMRGLR